MQRVPNLRLIRLPMGGALLRPRSARRSRRVIEEEEQRAAEQASCCDFHNGVECSDSNRRLLRCERILRHNCDLRRSYETCITLDFCSSTPLDVSRRFAMSRGHFADTARPNRIVLVNDLCSEPGADVRTCTPYAEAIISIGATSHICGWRNAKAQTRSSPSRPESWHSRPTRQSFARVLWQPGPTGVSRPVGGRVRRRRRPAHSFEEWRFWPDKPQDNARRMRWSQSRPCRSRDESAAPIELSVGRTFSVSLVSGCWVTTPER